MLNPSDITVLQVPLWVHNNTMTVGELRSCQVELLESIVVCEAAAMTYQKAIYRLTKDMDDTDYVVVQANPTSKPQEDLEYIWVAKYRCILEEPNIIYPIIIGVYQEEKSVIAQYEEEQLAQEEEADKYADAIIEG